MSKNAKRVESHFRNDIDHMGEGSSEPISNVSDNNQSMIDSIRDFYTECFNSLLLVSIGIGYKVNEENRTNPDIKYTLKMLSRSLKSKCRYFLDPDYSLCFQLKGGKEFEESNESGLVILLGVFACLRINLKYLEQKNPDLEGINLLLSTLYPDIMEAYDKVARKFGFDGTVNIGFNTTDPEELLIHLKKMKIERWIDDANLASETSKESNENGTPLNHSEKKSLVSPEIEKIGLSNGSIVNGMKVHKRSKKV